MTPRSLTLTSLYLILLTCMGSTSAAIYKWVDENGKTHYGERPVTQQAEKLDIKTRTPVPPPVKKDAAKDGKAKEETDAKDPEKDKTETAPKKQEPPQITKREKRARCKAARDQLANISQYSRLKEYDKKGNLVRLTEEQRQARIKSVNKNIRKYCR